MHPMKASFIEMDPRMPPSKRFFRDSQDFNFDFPIPESPLTLVHAGELFSNGYVTPLFIGPLKMKAYEASDSAPNLPTSSHAPRTMVPATDSSCSPLRRRQRLSKHTFQKYLDFIRPLYRRICSCRSRSRAESVDARVHDTVRDLVSSADTTPWISVAYSANDWHKSCDSESSIYEAVLHCKRSIGK